ncbi:MotA/TolQ/ExbB proton channel family protein [uncultured Thalassolituus sp.]|uniref:MotA/TolQ/ExbB proton channel family protein n=1 Tax=uncultured Thalassolituus sp. TaxID=285273 RepID=UPI002607DE88|nr:MotA/TolQ/ExbB proton channel family protein [uncultured Thalassolituus sp.]
MLWLTDFISQGGPVLYAVFAAAAILWMLILERLWFFYRVQQQLIFMNTQKWKHRNDQTSASARQIRSAWLSGFRSMAEGPQILIGAMIAVCPLLGLLGTVTGMIEVFDTLAIAGTGNARAMAGGISKATLPTMAGLVVALSGLYFRSRFQRLTQRLTQKLADQMPIGGE